MDNKSWTGKIIVRSAVMKITWVLVVAGVKRTEQGSVSDGDFAKT